MKLTKLIPITLALVTAACVGVAMTSTDPDQNKTPWTLDFKQPTLVDPAAFTAALNNASKRWERKVTIKDPAKSSLVARADVTQIPIHPILKSVVMNYPTAKQKANPSSLHVTQKIGLYNKADLDAIEQTIQYR